MMASDVYIKLDDIDLMKLEIIDRSFEEEVSRRKIIQGGINLEFATALQVLYREDELTEEEFAVGMSYLPHYLRDAVIKRMEAAADK